MFPVLLPSEIFVLTFIVSLLIAAFAVLTKGFHIHRTAKGHAGREVQSVHVVPTPRIGGVGLYLSLIVAAAFGGMTKEFLVVLGAAVPVFVAGFADDLGYSISPRNRLFAAMLSSLVAIVLTGHTIARDVFPGFDVFLGSIVVSAMFTIFVTSAVCHAFNLIDGMNGLSSTVAIASAVSLAWIAKSVGDQTMFLMALAVTAAVLGVFVLNFPFGKLFLGDAGAYSVGFFIAWIGVFLIERNPEIASWSILLAVFWPVMDTIAAVTRRLAKRMPIGAPDKLHFHHIVKRLLDLRLNATIAKRWSNPLTTVIMAPIIVFPPVLAATFYDNAFVITVCMAACTLLYFGSNRALHHAPRKL
ncbi:MraY family glycosyltransferase [Celeribacter sp.]|uniref:MraY family glycosyltransferase n=1 Tax=Celeribacter sp. TaxID=1890673 RepID=UPI003A94EAB4